MVPEIPISRSLSTDGTLPPKLDLHTGANSHIFQPPRTPSASSSLYRSTASIASGYDSGACTPSRKRSRHDSFASGCVATYTSDGNFWSPSASGQSSTLLTPGLMSPAPFVNTQYRLAAGLDTPTAIAALESDKSDGHAASSHYASRGGRGWDSGDSGTVSDSYFPQDLYALGREANGRPRFSTAQQPHEGWAKTVHRVVGAAGRLWNFCTMNAFHGFYAGGGPGYHMSPPKVPCTAQQNIDEHLDNEQNISRLKREASSIPGCFPEEDFIPDYMSQTRPGSERPAKKVRHDKSARDLGTNWVMVGNSVVSREPSPTRVSARKTPLAHSPRWRAPGNGGKKYVLPASRPSRTSCAGSPAFRTDRTASFAPSRSPLNAPKRESPVSVEAQKHAARMRRREMEDDAHLRRFNQQLKAMIKEGKEALGTKIVVENAMDDLTDEGYAEGDYFDEVVVK